MFVEGTHCRRREAFKRKTGSRRHASVFPYIVLLLHVGGGRCITTSDSERSGTACTKATRERAGSLLPEGQVLANGFDELHLQAAGALRVSLVTGPHAMLQFCHLCWRREPVKIFRAVCCRFFGRVAHAYPLLCTSRAVVLVSETYCLSRQRSPRYCSPRCRVPEEAMMLDRYRLSFFSTRQ